MLQCVFGQYNFRKTKGKLIYLHNFNGSKTEYILPCFCKEREIIVPNANIAINFHRKINVLI